MKTSNAGEVVGLRIFGGKIAPKWGRIFILDFVRNISVIHKKVRHCSVIGLLSELRNRPG